MASEITIWSTTPNANGTLGPVPIYWPEGQPPSSVNNCARQMMASIRNQWNDAQWFNWGYTVTRVSGNSFSVVTASWNTVTIANVFQAGGRLKLNDTSTLYGAITTVSVSAASVLVTFTPDANSLTASFSSVYNSIITPDLKSLPPGGGIPANVVLQNTAQIYGADGGATDAYAIPMSPTVTSLGVGQLINFKANSANTGAASLNVDGLGAITILKNGATNLSTNDILAGQIVSVIYDGTSFQMQSQVGNAAAITGGRLVSRQILTSGAAATYTRPGGINMILVEGVGGGGGGGATTGSIVTLGAGGGGGGGGYFQQLIFSPGATYTYTIGSGGAPAVSGNATTFGSLTANGGTLGNSAIAGLNGFLVNSGAGGTASGGDINQSGMAGISGIAVVLVGSMGGNGGSTVLGSGGTGGTSGTSAGSLTVTGGSALSNSGGGGGGASSNSDTSGVGGSGGSGLVIVWEFS